MIGKANGVLLAMVACLLACGRGEEDAPAASGATRADLLLHGGKVWTADPQRPFAEWVTIRGERIQDVGSGAPPPARDAIDLAGRLVVPGFNDSHVHFAQAGALLLGVNLLDVSDDPGFRRRVEEAAARLPRGSWITGGDWGAYEAWAMGSEGTTSGSANYLPSRSLVDDVTPHHPVLVRRYDRQVGLANAVALRELGLQSETGVLRGSELRAAIAKIPEKSRERRLAETRRALLECRRFGVTTVQDMSPLDQVDLYEELREAGELTCRIHFSPSRLPEYERMLERGWRVGAGDAWIGFGTIKSHIDGIMGARTARFFEPYDDNPPDQADWRGGWREFSEDLDVFERMLTAADRGGIQLRVHAIGDEANSILLDILERIERANGQRDRRFRLVHAQVLHPKDFTRLEHHDIVAEVQPYHAIDDMRWMEERIGHERCKGAYAFRSLRDAGCVLAFGSDWPGTNASYYPIDPLTGIYAAVTRQTVRGTPPEGWFPKQRIPLEEALAAYTRGSAYAMFAEEERGALARGMLADLAVLDTDLFETEPDAWLDARVDLTLVAGRVVHDRSGPALPARARESTR